MDILQPTRAPQAQFGLYSRWPAVYIDIGALPDTMVQAPLMKLFNFMSSLHWLGEVSDDSAGGVSCVEVLIMFKLLTMFESRTGRHLVPPTYFRDGDSLMCQACSWILCFVLWVSCMDGWCSSISGLVAVWSWALLS